MHKKFFKKYIITGGNLEMKLIKLRWINFWSIVTFLGFVVIFVLLLYPVSNILKASFIDNAGKFSLSNYYTFFSKKYYYKTILNSLIVAFGGTIGSLILGIPLAFFTTRFKIFGKSLLSTFAILALLSPPFIGAYSWIIMLGRNGFIRNFLSSIGINFIPPIYGAGGIILSFSLTYYPYVFLLTSAALTTIDRSLEEAAENLGCIGIKRFFKITLPLVMPSVSSGALIAFMLSLSNFGTPMILGERFKVLPTFAYDLFTSDISQNLGLASTVSMILIICSLCVLFLQNYVATRRKLSSILVNRPKVNILKGWKSIGVHLLCYFIVFLSMLPLIVVVYSSFRKTSGPVYKPGFSFETYKNVFYDVPGVIINSLIYSLIAVIFIVIFSVLLGFVLARKKGLSSKLLDNFLMIPYIVPGTVLGICLIIAYNSGAFIITGTSAILVMAYFIRRLPNSVRSCTSILRQIDPCIEEAGIILGAPPSKTLRVITLPLMFPGIMSGAILGWITSINELSASIVLYVGNTMTMPVRIYLSVLDGYFGTASALATILILVIGITLFIVNKFYNVNESFGR